MRDDPDQLVLLLTTREEFEARAIAVALEGEGIATHVFAASARGVAWHGGVANGVRVMVRRKDAAVAEEALYRARQASRAIDWTSVDVGEPEDETAAEIARGRAVRKRSVWAWRVRIGGMLLISSPFIVNMVGVQNAPLALAIVVLLMIVSWNPPTAEGRSDGRGGGNARAMMGRRG